MALITLLLVVANKQLKGEIKEKVKIKLEKDPKIKENLKTVSVKMSKLNRDPFVVLNRLIYYPTTLLVIIGMGDMFLGFVMLFGCILSYITGNQLKKLSLEVLDAVS